MIVIMMFMIHRLCIGFILSMAVILRGYDYDDCDHDVNQVRKKPTLVSSRKTSMTEDFFLAKRRHFLNDF